MSLTEWFIHRPVATWLMTLSLVLVGMLAYRLIPIAPLPDMEFPVIVVQATLPGASPEVIASRVATPLERSLGSISGVEQIASRSMQSMAMITIKFKQGQDIHLASQAVQAAINQAQSQLPSGMKSRPTFKKMNPAQAPIMVLALTSDVLTRPELYELATSQLAPRLSQITGVGEANVGGGAAPAVRIQVDQSKLSHAGLSTQYLVNRIQQETQLRPFGQISDGNQQWFIQSQTQPMSSAEYESIILKNANNQTLRLSDVAHLVDGVEDRFNMGFFNQDEAVLIIVFRQSGANILQIIEDVYKQVPVMQSILDNKAKLNVAWDRSPVIKATLNEAELALGIAILLVMMLVVAFLGDGRSSLIPSLAIPASLMGTCAVMYLLGFSLNVLSLMAIILAAGLVVDDAIVVLENIAKHIQQGYSPMQSAVMGSREVTATLIAMNMALVAVFGGVIMIGGMIGQFFLEFAVTLIVTILISLWVSLTFTPMLSAYWLTTKTHVSKFQKISEALQKQLLQFYFKGLTWTLAHPRTTLLTLFALVLLNIALFALVPKAFLPTSDSGMFIARLNGDDNLSYQALRPKVIDIRDSILRDPAVDNVMGFLGGSNGVNNAFFVIRLKDRSQRDPGELVLERLRQSLPQTVGTQMFIMADQDMFFGKGASKSQRTAEHEINLMGENASTLKQWLPKVAERLRQLPQITSINADDGNGIQQLYLNIDREKLAQLNLDFQNLSDTLNNAYSQRQIATLYGADHMRRVVIENLMAQSDDPEDVNHLSIIDADGTRIPFESLGQFSTHQMEDSINRDNGVVSQSISFDLANGVSLNQALDSINQAMATIGLPSNIKIELGGTAEAFNSLQKGQPLMLLLALLLVYLVLGLLYESYLHPLTILSTIPSATVGALLAIIMVGDKFNIISILGMFMLIGIVMKNAIMLIDQTLTLYRSKHISMMDATKEACLHRFRPILMTTLAAIMGAIPLLIGGVEGSEMRQPLGITLIGGLITSQLLTLYTTPVILMSLHRLKEKLAHHLT